MRSIPRHSLALFGLLMGLMACPALPDGPRYEGSGKPGPRRGGTLMIYEESRVRMLDPHVAFDATSSILINLLFDNLYHYDRANKLVPALASAMPTVSEGGRVFSVPLRHGVRFHNGRELTARDVVWSFERMLHPDLHSPGAPYYRAIVGYDAYQRKQAQQVAGLTAPDAYTFRIALERPDQSFIHTLAMHFSAPMPREAIEKTGIDVRRQPIGTGPFRLASWDPGVRLVLERNNRYFRSGLPYLDRVVFEEDLKRNTAVLRFRNGEVDIVPRMGPADQLILTSGGFKDYVEAVARLDVFALFMNSEMAPFDNVHVRRAVAFAIDRVRWAKARNWAIRPAGQILPPSIPGHDPNLPHLQHFDLARAKEEMRLAGFPKGLPEPVTMWTTDSATNRVYGELAQSDLARIGVELQLKPVSFPVYLEDTGKPRTAQMMSGGWSMDFPDASNILNLVSSSARAEQDSMNRAFFTDPKLDALLERALIERDPKRRAELYREANDFVADAAPWAIFCNTQAPHAWQPYVKGYRPHPVYWLNVSDVWLDLPRRRIAQLIDRVVRDSRVAQFLPLPGLSR